MDATKIIKTMKQQMETVMVGQSNTIDLLLTGLLAQGHVLIEDMPGTGKTVLCESLAKSIGGVFHRVQFTPDLLPSDVTGLNYYNQKLGEFCFKKGPAFCNVLLADEINRATPRTQSSLLECMAEAQITVDGESYPLCLPFMVVATQNPLETLGTYPLPEAQLDRFLMRVQMQAPTKQSEMEILNRFSKNQPLQQVNAVCAMEEIQMAIEAAKQVRVHPLMMEYIADIAVASRHTKAIAVGVSPRGSLALLRAAKAFALVQGRDYLVPEDIKAMAVPVLAHRLKLEGGFSTVRQQCLAVETLLQTVPVTTEDFGK